MIATNDVYDEDIPFKCNPLCSKLRKFIFVMI